MATVNSLPDDELEFRASDLISTAGVGSQGEKLLAASVAFYPEVLQAALLKRQNADLTAKVRGDEKLGAAAAKIAGVDKLAAIAVRGGELHDDEAMVTYAYLDSRGTVSKGCFPYPDLASGKSDSHVSQRDSLAASSVAQEHVQTRQSVAASAPRGPDTLSVLAEGSVSEVLALMEAHPEQVEAIKAFEETQRGEKARKSILEYEPPADDGEPGE